MSVGKCFTLNPLASSFIPGKRADTNYMKEMAEKYLKEFIEKKEASGENFLSKMEMATLVGHLISLRFKELTSSNILKINSYLSAKILNPEPATLKPSNHHVSVRTISKTVTQPFDLSNFQPPKRTFLLVAFWGLHRHEQAHRPLLSLPHRPEIVKDSIWSVDTSDKRLWNASCVKDVCQCPPMFGYTVPFAFFGNLLSLKETCDEQDIHLNHYAETAEGNEYILNCSDYNIFEEQPFVEDLEDAANAKSDLDGLAKQFESTITGLCTFLSNFNMDSDAPSKAVDADCKDHDQSLWDSNLESDNRLIPEDKEINDNVEEDEHPLLKVEEYEQGEGVSREIEEMIRRSLSPKKNDHSLGMSVEFKDLLEHEDVTCDPPCSIWCDAAGKSNTEDSTVAVDINLPSDLKPHSTPIPRINLVSPEELDPQAEPSSETACIVDLKPALNESGNRLSKPSFKRSFSVNDCDPFYYDAKFGFKGTMAQATNSMSSSDMLTFLKQDPVNFFKNFNRSSSWKDTDSGFVSHWSSLEDIFDRDQDRRGSMWALFSGEDSLWKPLPECVTPEEIDEKPLPHKRVKDLRRQRSLN